MMQWISRCHLFRYLKQEQLATLMEMGTARQVHRTSRIFEQGDPGESLFAILTGGVSIQQRFADGTFKTLALLGPGDTVGEMSVVDGQSRSAAAVAVDDSTLFELTRPQLVELVKTHPEIASRMLWALVETISVRLRQSEANYQAMMARDLSAMSREPKAGI